VIARRFGFGALLLGLSLPAAGHAACRVVFDVRVPAGTPAASTLWISGDRPELGNWNGAGFALGSAGEQRYIGGVELPEGADIAFKVTRGSWETVEKTSDGGE